MLWVYIQGLTSWLLWWEVFNRGQPGDLPAPPSGHLLATLQIPPPSDCDWPTDCSVCGYLCIYNFITPTHSFQFSIHVTCFCCSLVNTAGTSCLAIPDDRSVKGQYETIGDQCDLLFSLRFRVNCRYFLGYWYECLF